MAWKEYSIMDERLKFVGRLLEGEKMAVLCREFGITRRTGYKIFNRYKECGLEGLSDRSRRPYRHANQLPFQVERAILLIKKEYSNWGAAKIREKLLRQFPDIQQPATSTIHAILDRNGLVISRKRRRYKAKGTELHDAKRPNQLWCADYKGEFMLGNKKYCYPLTITDYHSRYLLAVEGQESTKEKFAFTVFERIFKEFGLPDAIRTDNGLPFASPNALYGLSKLSVWWLRLGIAIERIKPGNPQQNGRHERMHLTLKKETTKPPAFNILQQQDKFDDFVEVYNNQRPHQAIAMKYPGELYTPSAKIYSGLPDVDYPFADKTVTITQCGRICLGQKKINVSTVLAGQKVGITQTDDKIWLVSFMNFDLGYYDETACRLEPINNPFASKLYTMSQV
jgi:transposase InsO family protein